MYERVYSEYAYYRDIYTAYIKEVIITAKDVFQKDFLYNPGTSNTTPEQYFADLLIETDDFGCMRRRYYLQTIANSDKPISPVDLELGFVEKRFELLFAK